MLGRLNHANILARAGSKYQLLWSVGADLRKIQARIFAHSSLTHGVPLDEYYFGRPLPSFRVGPKGKAALGSLYSLLLEVAHRISNRLDKRTQCFRDTEGSITGRTPVTGKDGASIFRGVEPLRNCIVGKARDGPLSFYEKGHGVQFAVSVVRCLPFRLEVVPMSVDVRVRAVAARSVLGTFASTARSLKQSELPDDAD